MSTKKTVPAVPVAVTGSATWIIQRLEAELGAAVDEVLEEPAGDVALTLRGYWLLESIGDAPEHSQRELCDLLGVDRSDMVRLVDVLEDAGLVERLRDTRDRRRQLIGPTPAGVELRESIRASIAAAEARVFARVPAESREALTTLLDDVSAAPPSEPADDDSDDHSRKKSKKKRKSKKKGGKRQ
ncbi:MarR family winged helix-turn-helix transcriptional regulator [uncultured Corynebacterium sp.]|uniref:MarR family winged helix-turn-helix transcriptional regulator n=1 Tax=uncultured Corynebacterium sp. TaxID=159447 RepID=UPI0025E6FA37|nr:MarR family winged helix-turn-helix transcriptional regulator [uncultured Corynebacterium sp.]